MTFSILDMLDHMLADSRINMFFDVFQNSMHNKYIGTFIVSADIINLSQTTIPKHHINCFTVVFYIQPIPNLHSIAVNRQRFMQKRVIDHQGNQLFRELIRTVVIRASGDINRKLISVRICLDKQICRRLA